MPKMHFIRNIFVFPGRSLKLKFIGKKKKKKKASDGLFPIVKCMRRKQNELQSYAGGILINEETLTAKYGQSDS